jgi:hypothetical protein
MTMLLQKGSGYNYEYHSTDYPTLTADWTGSVSLFATYPGVATFTKAMTINGNVMQLALTNSEVLNLSDGVYTVESTISNDVLGIAITSINYAIVTPINVSASTMCKIFGTIEKLDGSPSGIATSTIVNVAGGGVILQAGWKGVDVKAAITVADADSGKIVSIETITTQTNAAGYFELYVLQGTTPTVTCPSFGKSVAVSTTGQTLIDISTFF